MIQTYARKRLGAGLILAAAVLTAGCNSMSDKPADGFSVEGKIDKPIAGQYVALYKVSPSDFTIIDSVEANDGKFRFVGKVNQLQMFMLKLYGQQSTFFVAGNEDIEVEVKGAVPNAKVDVKAGPEQEKLRPVLAMFARQGGEMQPMRYEYELAVQNRDMARAEKYRGMLERGSLFFKGRYKHLIDSLGPSFAAYTAATQLDMQADFGYIDTLSGQLAAKYKGQAWADDFARQVLEVKATAVGQPAPDFKQATPEGKMVGPADFKGKYVVLDFWASWCKPCRMNSPAMVGLYQKYKGKGVEILGISLDKDADRWKAAIADDKYTWPQVSDLQEWQNAAARAYKVDGIPHLVLLDPQGRIVARNLNPQELDILLANVTAAM